MSSSATSTPQVLSLHALNRAALPIVDLAAPEEAPRILYDACRDFGFFYLINHGVPQALIDDMLTESKAFFSLPLDEKEKVSVRHNKINRGYTAFEEETLDPTRQTRGDTKEGFYLGREVAMESEEARSFPLHGPNVWPDPVKLPRWRPVMNAYFTALSSLGLRTVRLLLRALGLPEHHLDDTFTRPMAALRLLHYSTQASNPSEGVYAAGAHTDYGMFTFLMTDHTPGLQVWRGGAGQEDGSWQEVPAVEGAFIVNLGDMLQRWTNDVFKSTAHRVVIQEATEEGRYSAPFFYEPNFDTLVACLPGFVKEGEVPRHVPIKSGEYLLGKYRQTHRDFVEKADDNHTLENHAG
ncbi:Isopenicillin N synthase [Nannochloropsis gaditana]|uniref:Isopenicillin N synthase n=1 Tax=Nannochloropsis gaditana TaxID=72520 RepID=W7T122_9STRA|nr:Isopenicillin N synthase [Nannochloropsis gaditana]